MDVVGPTRAPSLSGSRYFLTIADNHARAVWVYPLKTKGEVAAAVLKEWMLRAQRESGHKVKVIRTDNGGEFIGADFEVVLKKKGIQHQLTVPYQNAVAECFNQTLQEGARTLLGRAGLPDPFWVTALRQVALMKNRVLATVGDKQWVPYTKWYGSAPAVNMLRAYGCMVVFHVPKEKRGKLEASGRWGQQQKLPTTPLIIEDDEVQRPSRQVQVTISEEQISGVTEDGGEPEVEEEQQQQQDAPPPVPEPKTLAKALSGPDAEKWKQSVKEEYDSLLENETWELCELPPRKKAISSKLIFKHKYGPDGELTCYKSRLVTKVFQQTKGKDFDEISALVGKGTTLRYSAVRQRQQRGAADLGNGEMLLTCYTDASFNSVKADGTSIGGYVCLFGGGAVSWRTKKQNEVGLSSCETEYMALHHGVKEVVRLRRLLEEIGVCQREPTMMFCDNESAVKLDKNACLHGLTKHIRPKWHWVRRLLDKEVRLEIVKTRQQAADILTKRLAENEHWKGMNLTGMSDRAGQTCGKLHTQHRFFSRLDDAWRAEFGDEAERPRWAELLRYGVDIFALDYDAILAAMYALSVSAEGDCYLCVLPDPGIEAAALGASESALPGTTPAKALHTFTLDSSASSCFFCDSTTLTPLSAPIPVRLTNPLGGPVLACSSTVLLCSAVLSGSLSRLHLPSFSTNLVSTAALQDAMVTTTTLGGQRVSICTCTRMGRHLAMFTRWPGLSLYALTAEPTQTLLWKRRLGHPSLPRLRGMHPRLLVSGVPRSLPPLPPSPAPPCLPCVEGRQGAAPHSSSFPPTTAPLQTLNMDVKGEVPDVLIPWIRAVRLQLRERFHEDLPVLRLHSDRGGEFSSDLLRDFCRGEGILQSFTLPASPHQNGVVERRIGLVMEVARTSMIHAAAPHFL
ncbi:unnamed protein product [Closterium sp. NIES-53]